MLTVEKEFPAQKTAKKVLSAQEQRIARGAIVPEGSRLVGTRLERMLDGFLHVPPRVSIDRARLFTESFKQTEGMMIEVRAAKALAHMTSNIDIAIGDEELIVGHCTSGTPGRRYGVLYPEIHAGFFASLKDLPARTAGAFAITQEDIRVIEQEIMPYWKGKTLWEAYTNLLPENVAHVFFKPNSSSTRGVIDDLSTIKAMADWIPDYQKVIQKGFNGIKREAEERLESLDPLHPKNTFEKRAFLQAVIIVCDAMVTFGKRYAALASATAKKEKSARRKKELLEIAEVCAWVPGNPARTFREALQSLWFTRCGICFEQEGAGIGNGRIDQYLYPFYERDVREGRITKDDAMELLQCVWMNMAQYKRLRVGGTIGSFEGYPHFEQTTVGGQTRDGRDATNELSYLVLQSKIDWPLDTPDLMVRIHSRTPQAFLMKACECAKQGTGFPKFENDEEIVPNIIAKSGVPLEEALDYAGSGCVEARLPNLDIYAGLEALTNIPTAVEMALKDGKIKLANEVEEERLGVRTGDESGFTSFDDVMNAFRLQAEHLIKLLWTKQTVLETVKQQQRPMAAPLISSLNDRLMDQCVDIHSNRVKGGIRAGGKINLVGFGTVVDSLAAIKKLVYDDKTVTINGLLEALENNFEGKEALRQMCLNAPKYGNNDPYVDSIAHEVQGMLLSIIGEYTCPFGLKHDLVFVPVSSNVSLGAALGPTPDGRKAKEPVSNGVGPTQGCDVNGPTAVLLSVAAARNTRGEGQGAQLLNIKLSPQAVAGEEGTRNLAALIRTWCDLKLWHIQFNVVNADTLREAQKDPERYRDLLVRVSGYSAYFVDLSPRLQNEIIGRTEHHCAC
ncbi:MAG: glycyl radical protein [Betaproteobacteria bacterium]|nr:glycyl radical protein [Betaproteobacteria bacterium]